MSPVAILIYEIIYGIIFFGLLFSKITFLELFPNPSNIRRILFVIILFNGFYIPFYLKLLKIKLRTIHYAVLLGILSLLYIIASWQYYAHTLSAIRFRGYHPYLQNMPPAPTVAVSKPKGVFRIVCLGGSSTEGAGDGGYPKMLEEMLRSKYPDRKIEVINGGRYFYSSQNSFIEYLFYLKDFNPDLIIFFEAVNDLVRSFTMPIYASSPFRADYGHFYGPLARFRYPTSFEKFIFSFFYADLRIPKLKPAPFSDFKSQYSFQRNLETFIAIARSNRTPLIYSNQAYNNSTLNDNNNALLQWAEVYLVDDEHYADIQSWITGMELFNKITTETAEKFSIPFVDQVTPLRDRPELFYDAFHVIPEGNRLKAQLFFEKIVELKLIESKNTQ